MRKPSQLFATQLKSVYAAIENVESGGSSTLVLRGRSWSAIEDLYRLAELVRLDAAIAAIEEGAQSYTIDDHSFSRAELRTLYERRDRAQANLVRATRGGMRVRNVVPL